MDRGETGTSLAIFGRFFRFGLLAWGGPIAQIAMLKRELVEEERWVSPSRFNRLLAVYQVLPGPEAHELCVHFGMLKGRRLGGFLAGFGFMLPGFVLILALAVLYQRLDLTQPLLKALFLGVQLAVLALIVRAIHRIATHALTSRALLAIAIASAGLTFAGESFWIILPLAALCGWGLSRRPRPGSAALAVAAVILLAAVAGHFNGSPPANAASPRVHSGAASAMDIFLSGLKAGLLTFGGAYTAIPFVRHDAVGRGWVTDGQFLDGLALSSVIPAPLIIFATFVGYLAGGLAGALAMTAGIFLPAFAFGMLFYDQLERVIDDQRLHAALEGIAAAVVGVVAVTAVDLGRTLGGSVPAVIPAILLFAATLAVLYRSKSKWAVPAIMLGGAIAGGLAFGP